MHTSMLKTTLAVPHLDRNSVTLGPLFLLFQRNKMSKEAIELPPKGKLAYEALPWQDIGWIAYNDIR